MIKQALAKAIIKTSASKIKKHFFTHATNKDNLEKILKAKKLAPLSQVARDNPNEIINVEAALTGLQARGNLGAADAAKAMANKKEIDKLFLTKDGYLPHYGDYVIGKNMAAPDKRVALNLVPNEYTTNLSVALNDASIYVPDEELLDWMKRYPGMSFEAKSKMPGKAYSRLHGAASLPSKAIDYVSDTSDGDIAQVLRDMGLLSREAMIGASVGAGSSALLDEDSSLKDKALMAALGAGVGAGHKSLKGLGGLYNTRLPSPDELQNITQKQVSDRISPKALLAGSKPLGLDIAGSDTDILVPYKTDFFFNRALRQMQDYKDFRPSALNAIRPDKQVFTYNKGGKDIDIVLGRGSRPFAFRDAFLRAKKNLTDEHREHILAEKEALKNAWFLRESRYKNYKNQLAEDLGLREHYF